MVAAVETYKDMAAFASLRRNAWWDIDGAHTFDEPVTTSEMLDLAHLSNWNLRMEVLKIAGQYSDRVEYAVLRDNPFMERIDRLGIVGTRYKLFSNEELFAFGDNLTNERRRWETAGSLFGGRQVFATLVDTEDIVLDPNGSGDVIKKYLMLTTSHDGSGKIIAKKVNTRVECANTLNMAMKENGAEFSIRHTQNLEGRLGEAKLALGFADDYDAEFEAAMQTLYAKDMTMVEFEKIVLAEFPEPDAEKQGAYTRWENKIDLIMDIWSGSTKSMQGLPNNAYKGVQTLFEHNQWFRGIRKDSETEEPNIENFLAAGMGFEKPTNDFRNRVMGRFMEFATA
jgi:phage/plasmid-like protein (TIGR03299 family)